MAWNPLSNVAGVAPIQVAGENLAVGFLGSTGTTGGPARGTETDSILTEDGGKIGVARVRSFDTAVNNSTVTDFLSNSADNDSQFNLGLFDIKMFTEIDFDGVEVQGELVKPQGSLLLERKHAKFNPMIKLRTDFDDLMEDSVQEVK